MSVSREKLVYAYFFSIAINGTKMDEVLVTHEEPNLFEDPFNTTWLKISSTFSYLLGCFTSSILWCFAFYHAQGHASHYATVVNQLVNWTCLLIAFYTSIIIGFDYLRVLVGPLPYWLCSLTLIVKGTLFMSLPMVLTAITMLKFFFICIWKKMKVMNDDLIARIVILATTFLSFSLYLVKFLGPGKPVLNTIICTGVYLHSYENLGPRFPPELFIILLAFVINICLMILINVKRRRNESFDDKYVGTLRRNNIPTSLESLIWNVVLLFCLLFGVIIIQRSNETRMEDLDGFPNNLYPFFTQFIVQVLPSIFMSIHILTKHGKKM